MLRLHHFTPALTVGSSSPFEVPEALVERVREHWQAALAERPGLFDGPILTVTALGRDHIEVAPTSYRFLLAAKDDPELKAALNLRPLAVSGLLRCPKGYVFGHRALTLTEAPGVWELVPSGGVEPSGALVDVKAQVLKELREEIGLETSEVQTAGPVGCIEDLASGVIDIVIPMSTPRTAAEIRRAHETKATREYSELHFGEAAPGGSDGLLAVSREILAHFAGAQET